jgi:hypothetical protein
MESRVSRRCVLSRSRQRCGAPFDPWAEFKISPLLNQAMEMLADIEQALIGRGMSLPAGGSLLLAARKPVA